MIVRSARLLWFTRGISWDYRRVLLPADLRSMNFVQVHRSIEEAFEQRGAAAANADELFAGGLIRLDHQPFGRGLPFVAARWKSDRKDEFDRSIEHLLVWFLPAGGRLWPSLEWKSEALRVLGRVYDEVPELEASFVDASDDDGLSRLVASRLPDYLPGEVPTERRQNGTLDLGVLGSRGRWYQLVALLVALIVAGFAYREILTTTSDCQARPTSLDVSGSPTTSGVPEAEAP